MLFPSHDTATGLTTDGVYTSSADDISGYGNNPVLTSINKTIFPDNKPIIFMFSFTTNTWRVIIPVMDIDAYSGDILTPYSISDKTMLWHYNVTPLQESMELFQDKTGIIESLYVSKKLYLSSEFTKSFIYHLKLNMYRLHPGSWIKINFYEDNIPVKIIEFDTNTDTYDRFIQIDTWDSIFSNNQKFNYIILEVFGRFEDVQSIGMMVRGLIR